MTDVREIGSPARQTERFFIDGSWVDPSSTATFDVIDSGTERLYFTVAEAKAADMDRAIHAARQAYDEGPWPTLRPSERASFLQAIGAGVRDRANDFADVWARQSGIVRSLAAASIGPISADFDFHAGLAETFAFTEEIVSPLSGVRALKRREPVGVVAAIVPWNAPLTLITNKVAPALLAGCTVVLKASPEAPGEAYLIAEIAESVGLPPGVLNVVTADREVSESLVRDPRVDKISFTGSTAAGRRIASVAGERLARYTLELGGKSAAVILDDADLENAAGILATAACIMTGQACGSMTRIVVGRDRHDDMVEALSAAFTKVVVGDPFDELTGMGPLATSRQRDRVESLVDAAVASGIDLVLGGRRPPHLDRGFFFEPTIFGNVDNRSPIAQTEIFGPVVCVIPVSDDDEAVSIANDTVYGLNASVFTDDADRAWDLARRLRSGTVGFNGVRGGRGLPFGGMKQSGVGRDGGIEGLLHYTEMKTVVLDGAPSGFGAGDA